MVLEFPAKNVVIMGIDETDIKVDLLLNYRHCHMDHLICHIHNVDVEYRGVPQYPYPTIIVVTVVSNVFPAWHQAPSDAMMVFLMYSGFIKSYQMYLVLQYERTKLSLFEGVINPSHVPTGHNHLYFLEGPTLRPNILDSALMVLSACV